MEYSPIVLMEYSQAIKSFFYLLSSNITYINNTLPSCATQFQHHCFFPGYKAYNWIKRNLQAKQETNRKSLKLLSTVSINNKDKTCLLPINQGNKVKWVD